MVFPGAHTPLEPNLQVPPKSALQIRHRVDVAGGILLAPPLTLRVSVEGCEVHGLGFLVPLCILRGVAGTEGKEPAEKARGGG